MAAPSFRVRQVFWLTRSILAFPLLVRVAVAFHPERFQGRGMESRTPHAVPGSQQ